MTSAAPQQLDFLLALYRPLLLVDEAAALLGDVSKQHVAALIDEGTLRAVDISAAGEEGSHRALRIYRYTVEHLLIAPARPLAAVPVETILPHSRLVLRRDEVATTLNCTPRHVANLPLAGPRLSGSVSAGSADRTPRTFRASLLDFLITREVKP